MITVAYDTTLKRPGCAIIQAVFGATISNAELMRMDGWLLSPTEGMRLYEVTDEQLNDLVALTNGRPES